MLLCEAPLVEGAVAAAARARTGASLEEVATEARAALGMKASQLGVEAAAPRGGDRRRLAGGRGAAPRGAEHARPARAAGRPLRRDRLRASTPRSRCADETTGRGPADARSLTALITLGARQGHAILVQAAGPEADAALAALRELADDNFGDDDDGGAAAATPAAPAAPPASARPRRRHGVLQGVPAASGIAIAPARTSGGSDPLTSFALQTEAFADDEP